MGSMTHSASILKQEDWKQLDDRLRRVDEDRWLSSRYATDKKRQSLIGLYLFYYELARVRLVVTEATLGAIRFQWWRDALEELAAGKMRQHDVVFAISEALQRGELHIGSLIKLINEHEVAFETGDRAQEPEGRLVGIAAYILGGAHRSAEDLRQIAPHWAALRRGENVGYGPVINKIPSAIRPAAAHFRLRRLYARGKGKKALQRRLSVMRAILSGQI